MVGLRHHTPTPPDLKYIPDGYAFAAVIRPAQNARVGRQDTGGARKAAEDGL